MAAKTLWCFLVPLVVVLCTASADFFQSDEWKASESTEIDSLDLLDSHKKPKCPSKEVWVECSALCQRNCTNFNDHPGICPQPCVAGCICKPGYVRGPNGRCVKTKNCPGDRRCPKGERFDECSYLCQKNCTNYDQDIACTYGCFPGCVCPQGYVRSVFPSGKCVKTEKCPKNGEEFIWDEENASEERSLEDEEENNENLSEESWNEDSAETENFCPSNEEFVKCDAKYESDCGNTPLQRVFCVSGCRCVSGYVRGPKGTCIEEEQCPEKDNTRYPVKRICPKNELWNTVIAHCQTNCSEPDFRPCPIIPVSGCVCKRGFLRRDDGKCVSANKCPKTDGDLEDQQPPSTFCPKNELFSSCIGHCEPDCKKNSSAKAYQECNKSICVSECQCQFGFVRGPKGTCIKSQACPKKDNTKYPVKRVCPQNEQWEVSKAHCQKNCTNIDQKIPCLKIKQPGCVCKSGLLRGKDGKCVPKDKCTNIKPKPPPTFCPENENFSCLGHCEPDCKKNSSAKAYQDCNKSICVAECGCKFGFVRGPKGTCIKPEACPKKDKTKYPVKRVCPKNEQWEVSTAHCQKNCTNINQKISCLKIKQPGCVCKSGLLRGKDGKCIEKKKCPKKADEFDLSNEEESSSEFISSSNEEKDIFWSKENRDDSENLNDEDSEEAKAKPYCPPNEFFAACIGNCEPDCKDKTKTLQDCNRSLCVSECKCKWGFVRGPKGDCIKPEKCPAKDKTKYPVKRKCPAKEQWETSRAHCQTNCTTVGKKVPCTKIAVAGCVCKKDLYRNKDGQCVPKKQCPKKADELDASNEEAISSETNSPSTERTDAFWYEENEDTINLNDDEEDSEDAKAKPYCPSNEFFAACIGNCEPDCKDKTKTLQDCNKSLCVSECKCKWGFVRGPKGDCIKPEKCPAKDKTKYPVKRKCPAKEQWETSRAHCQTNCTTVGKKVPCTKIAVAGCVCKKDLYRNKDGQCVPKKQCPKKADEFDASNEEDISSETDAPSTERTDAFWYEENEDTINLNDDEEDSEDGKAKTYCPSNEFFAACIGNCEPDCKDKTKTLQDCNRSLCVSECKCKWGFVRGPKGDCIKPEKCPAKDKTKYPVKRKCPSKEQWETSRAHCQTNCTTVGKKVPCPKIAVAGCVCKKDLYRNKEGQCVPKKQCPKKSDMNEPEADNEEDSWTDSWTEVNMETTTESDSKDEEYYNESKSEEVLEGPGGCPSLRKCTAYCTTQGKRAGRCVGRHRRRCHCIP